MEPITRAVGNAEFREKSLRFVNRVIPVLLYHSVCDISTFLPFVCTLDTIQTEGKQVDISRTK